MNVSPAELPETIARSPAMRKVLETIEQVAPSDVDVLITGETGTGKELVTRTIHAQSPRAEGPFVPVDCGAIPENLLESEFFGYERGAFTGADKQRVGLLEFADGGTFFLDEIGELPLLLQAKLLRTLQERKLRRVGGNDEVPVNVRVLAATGRDLKQMVERKEFREDLYYRINVVHVSLPPLRDRGDDLGLLAEHFAERFSREMGRPTVGIAPDAYAILRQYRWPGNIRELQNVIRRAIVLTQDDMVDLDDLPETLLTAATEQPGTEGVGFFEARAEHMARFERDYLTALLEKHAGNVTAAADEAKVPRGTLYRLMKNHALDGADFR
jgi:transcriptional regulator with PAS, ATPase and Fis domain